MRGLRDHRQENIRQRSVQEVQQEYKVVHPKKIKIPKYIIILVRDLKYPTTVLNTSRPTKMRTKDKKDLIAIIIQTEEIK